MNNSKKKLNRNTKDKVFGGVCSGLADYFGKSVILIRVILFILTLFFCVGLILYIGLWIGIPNKKNIDPNSNKLNSILGGLKNLLFLTMFITLGCFLGFSIGGVLGSKGNGGVSNFNGAVIGLILSLIVWIKIVSKKN